MIKLLILFITFVATPLVAHEGHHEHVGAISPPKGGVVRSLETIHLEMLQQGEVVKVYVYDLKLKPLEAKDYPVSALVTRPKKTPEKIKLETKKDHWEFAYDAKGSHRYKFQLDIEQGGHKDSIKWNIEPKK